MKNSASTFCARTRNVTYGSHQMEKYNFSVTCPDKVVVEPALGPPEYENSASTSYASDTSECTMSPMNRIKYKSTSLT
jgi:hypothetical protein